MYENICSLISRAGTRLRQVGMCAKFKEALTLRMVQVQGGHLRVCASLNLSVNRVLLESCLAKWINILSMQTLWQNDSIFRTRPQGNRCAKKRI